MTDDEARERLELWATHMRERLGIRVESGFVKLMAELRMRRSYVSIRNVADTAILEEDEDDARTRP